MPLDAGHLGVERYLSVTHKFEALKNQVGPLRVGKHAWQCIRRVRVHQQPIERLTYGLPKCDGGRGHLVRQLLAPIDDAEHVLDVMAAQVVAFASVIRRSCGRFGSSARIGRLYV